VPLAQTSSTSRAISLDASWSIHIPLQKEKANGLRKKPNRIHERTDDLIPEKSRKAEVE
jgi:hypothetical protein